MILEYAKAVKSGEDSFLVYWQNLLKVEVYTTCSERIAFELLKRAL